MSAETKVGVEETIESLTGYDEIAIAKHFDMEWSDLAERKPSMFTRALVFVLLTRRGQSAPEAKKAVLAMSMKDAQDHFDTEDEPVPDDPVSSVGKGDEQPD